MRKETCKKCGRVYELEDNEGLATCICEMKYCSNCNQMTETSKDINTCSKCDEVRK